MVRFVVDIVLLSQLFQQANPIQNTFGTIFTVMMAHIQHSMSFSIIKIIEYILIGR